MHEGKSFDRLPLALAALTSGAILAWRVLSIETWRDPIAAWSWGGGDTWDFVGAGLALRGAPVGVGIRTPLLPLLVALGDASGLLGVVPLLGLVAACAAPVLLAREVAGRAGGLAASAAALALLVSQTWLRHGIEWMADVPAAVMFALGVAALAPSERPPRWIRAGIMGGLATITSQVGLLLVPVAVIAIVLARPRGGEGRRAVVGAVLPVAGAGAWLIVRAAFFDAPRSTVQHWSFLGLHVDGLAPYLWQVVAAWGWPGSLIALVGLVVLGRRALTRPLEIVPVVAVLTTVIFWGVLYGFHAPRFVVTVLPLLVLPTALGLVAIPGRGLRVAAACVVVLAAAWPLRGFVADGSRLPLMPPIVLRVPLTSGGDGSVTPRLAGARATRGAPRISDLAWVAVRRPAPLTTVAAGAFNGAAGAIVVDSAPERRYERTRHAAALVRAPAVRVPRMVAETLPLAAPRGLGTRGGFAFTRARSPLDGRDWILAVPVGEQPPALRERPYDPVEVARARAIAALRGDRHVVAVVEPGTSWWAWLCLLVPGDWLHYVVPEELAGLETFLAGSGRSGRVERVDGLVIEPIESLGRVGIVVRAAAAR